MVGVQVADNISNNKNTALALISLATILVPTTFNTISNLWVQVRKEASRRTGSLQGAGRAAEEAAGLPRACEGLLQPPCAQVALPSMCTHEQHACIFVYACIFVAFLSMYMYIPNQCV